MTESGRSVGVPISDVEPEEVDQERHVEVMGIVTDKESEESLRTD